MKSLHRTFLLPLIFYFAVSGFAQNVGGMGPQFGEATNGDVSLDTLNVHLSIPIVSKTGVGLPFSYALTYDSNVWYNINNYWQMGWRNAMGFWAPITATGSLSYGQTIPCGGDVQITPILGYTDAAGSLHQIPAVSLYPGGGAVGTWGVCYAVDHINELVTDGSGYTINAYSNGTTDTVVTAGGTVISFGSPATKITDPNGNLILGPSSIPLTYTDTFGVQELSWNSWGCTNGGAQTFAYPTSTGTAPVTVNCTDYKVQTYFQCGIPYDVGPTSGYYFPTAISLPDGSSYSFTYESQVANTITGRIASVTYPSGQVVKYQYTGPNNGINCKDGSTSGLTRTVVGDAVYQYTRNTTTWLTTTLVSDYGTGHSNNTNVYTFSQNSSTSPISLTQSVENQGSSTLLRTKVYCYNTNQTNCATAPAPNPPITQRDVYTTLAGMSTSSRTSTTYDKYGNVTMSAVYDFGASTPTRQSVMSNYGYSWNGSTTSPKCTTAIGNGIMNRPCQMQLQNGSGGQLKNTYYQYQANTGNLLSTAVWTGGSSYLMTSATYNSNGTVATSTDANNNTTTIGYQTCNSSSNSLPTTVTSPITSLAMQMTWDFGCNGAKLLSVTDPNGASIGTTYNDPFWRPTSRTDYLSNTLNLSYYPTVPLNTTEAQMTFGSSDFDEFDTADAMGRPVLAQRIEGPNGSWDTSQTGYSWNTTGRVASKTMPCVTAKSSGCTNGTTTVTHDALGRPLVKTDGGGGTLTYTYSGSSTCTSPLVGCEITTVVLGPAPAGEVVKKTAQEYNGLGQLLASCVISSASGSSACGFGGYTGVPTTYYYNPDGTVAQVVRGSQAHSFSYDAIGRTLTATYPESGKTTYTYDGNGCWGTPMLGLLTSTTDSNNNGACYTYDTLNRVVAIGYSGPNWDGYDKFFVYDSATVNGVTMVNALGRLAEAYTGYGPACYSVSSCLSLLTKVTDEGFSYTARGQISDVYESTPNSGGYYHTTATYFANGAVNTLSGVSGGPWTYAIDGKGRPYSAIAGASTNLVSSTTYNPADEPCVVTLGLGDTDTYVYDNNATCTSPLVTGRLTSYTFSVGTGPTTETGSLSWNANGTLNDLAIVDGFNTGSGTETCTYGSNSSPGYDEFGRLLQVNCVNGNTNIWNQTFSYDIYDNITKTGSISWACSACYNQANNRYNSLIGASVSYDSNGNLLTDTFHTYTWNQDNHPIAMTDVGITMTYDAFGRMVEKATGSTYQQTLISPIGTVALMSQQNITQFRMPLPGGDTAVSGVNFYHRDHLGSVPLITSKNDRGILPASIASRLFAPYGESYSNEGINGDVNFTGDNQDLVAGTFDTPGRELNPTQGRWISPDPAHASWNAYEYSTNPLGQTDPSGLNVFNGIWAPLNIGLPTGGSGGEGDYPGTTGPIDMSQDLDGTDIWEFNFGQKAWSSNCDWCMMPGRGDDSALDVATIPGVSNYIADEGYDESTGVYTFYDIVRDAGPNGTGTQDHSPDPPITKLLKYIINRPWSGGILIPVGEIPTGPAGSISIDPTKGFAVISVGWGVGLRGANAGPLWGDTGNSSKILSGASVSGNLAGPLGVQRIENQSGALWGPTAGSPGVSIAVTYGWCFGNCQ